MTIEELQRDVEQGLEVLRSPEYAKLHNLLRPLIPPPGYQPRVLLYGEERKKKRTAPADKWRAEESHEIRISFELPKQSSKPAESLVAPPESVSPAKASARQVASDPLSDLVRALDRVESRPGLSFVALKWFRDVALPAEGFLWTRSDSDRQSVLRTAIEGCLILTSRIPNPKAPQFPTTSIRLNRHLPQVEAILGAVAHPEEDFVPKAIRGEALSTTILRERR